MTGLKITIEGEEELNRLLDKMSGPELKKVAGKATSSAAQKVLKPQVQLLARASTVKLPPAISAGQARKDRPAGIVKINRRKAWWGHFMVTGTRPHRIRFPDQKAAGVPKEQGNIRHPGIRANPIFDKAQATHGNAAVDHVADELWRSFGLD